MGFTEFIGWTLVSIAIIPHLIFERLGGLYIRGSAFLLIFGIPMILIGRAETKQNKRKGKKK